MAVRLVTVKMPEIYVRAIDELVKAGRYTSRSEAVRVAIRELLRQEIFQPELTLRRLELEKARIEVAEA